MPKHLLELSLCFSFYIFFGFGKGGSGEEPVKREPLGLKRGGMTAREKRMLGREKKQLLQQQEQEKQSSSKSLMARSNNKRERKRHSPSPRPDPIKFSFFKVLIGDFRDVLFIPPMAACTLKDLSKKYVYVEDSDGNTWNVKMSMVDGSLAFQKGWHDFVSAHSMKFGEFVLFTYNGGLLFKARIFGRSSLERTDFQLKTSSNRCLKESYVSELSPNNVRSPKSKKARQEIEDKHWPSTTEDMLKLNREEETAPSDLPKFTRIETDYISKGLAEVPSAVEKPQRVSDATIVEKLNMVSFTELVKPDGGNFEAIESKNIINNMDATGQGDIYLNGGQTLLSTHAAGKTHAKVQNDYAWPINTYSHIKEALPGMSCSQMQGKEVNGKMETKVNMNKNSSHNFGHNDSDGDKMAAVSSPKHADCSPEMEEFLIEQSEANLKFLLREDGVCFIVDENFSELATGPDLEMHGKEDSVFENDRVNFCSETYVQSENIPAVSTTLILGCTKGKKESMMPTSQEIGDLKAKGISHDASTDTDKKDVISCSDWGSQIKLERADFVDIPSLSSILIVRLSDDDQSSLELPEVLACQNRKIINERKVVMLQDPSMKCWPVLYHESLIYVGFIGGWMDFARANNICRGDICELELVDDKKELIFQVQIFKA